MFSTEYLITSLIVVLIPGTGVIFTVSTALLQGRSAGVLAALGGTIGIVPHLLATIFGLAAVMHTSALAFEVLRYAGVAYLFYVAWATWRDKAAFAVDSAAAQRSGRQIVWPAPRRSNSCAMGFRGKRSFLHQRGCSNGKFGRVCWCTRSQLQR